MRVAFPRHMKCAFGPPPGFCFFARTVTLLALSAAAGCGAASQPPPSSTAVGPPSESLTTPADPSISEPVVSPDAGLPGQQAPRDASARPRLAVSEQGGGDDTYLEVEAHGLPALSDDGNVVARFDDRRHGLTSPHHERWSTLSVVLMHVGGGPPQRMELLPGDAQTTIDDRSPDVRRRVERRIGVINERLAGFSPMDSAVKPPCLVEDLYDMWRSGQAIPNPDIWAGSCEIDDGVRLHYARRNGRTRVGISLANEGTRWGRYWDDVAAGPDGPNSVTRVLWNFWLDPEHRALLHEVQWRAPGHAVGSDYGVLSLEVAP